MTAIVPYTFNLNVRMLEFLPVELWAIIFKYKWRLEIKDCLKELQHYQKRRKIEHTTEYCYGIAVNGDGDNYKIGWGDWWKLTTRFKGGEQGVYTKRIRVPQRCGIEILQTGNYSIYSGSHWNIGNGELKTNADKQDLFNILERNGVKYAKSWNKKKLMAKVMLID